MANPFTVAVPSALEALMAFDGGEKWGRDRRNERSQSAARLDAQNALMQGGDTRSALAKLIGAGDIQGANALANFGNQASDQQYKAGMLDIARQNANRQDTPQPLQILRAAGIDPASSEGRKALFPRTDTPISATDKKAIFEAEDAQPQIKGTIEALQRAKDLNSQTFTGAGASTRSWLGTKLPDMMVPDFVADPQGSKATEEWSKIMGPEALQTMANTLKGATTDFELKKFIEMLADPSTTVETRGKVLDRMMTLAERKNQLNESRIKDLRGGNYFKPGQGQPQGGPVKVGSPQERDALAPGTQYIAPDGSVRTKQ